MAVLAGDIDRWCYRVVWELSVALECRRAVQASWNEEAGVGRVQL